MKRLLATPLIALLASCASVSLPEDAATFVTASGTFSASLKEHEAERLSALAETQRAAVEGSIARGLTPKFDEQCATRAKPALDGWDAAAVANYDPGRADAAFAALRGVEPCRLYLARPDASPAEEATPSTSAAAPAAEPTPLSRATGPTVVVGVGADTLAGSASALDEYAAVVADIVANKSGAKQDAAASGMVESLGKLLEAVGLKGAGAASGLVGQIAASAIAADRNVTFRERLRRQDAVMPYILERIGHAGRLTTAQTISNRLQAAQQRATSANILLKPEALPSEKARTFVLIAPGVDRQNEALVRLRVADPMIAARGFAEAHHALVEAYAGGKGRTPALAAGTKAFSKAAAELATALEKED